MLINSNEKKGLVNINDALEAAKNESLDLVQVSRSDSDPGKLLDYGKYVFEKKKNASSSKNKTKRNAKKIKLGLPQMRVITILNKKD